jgi:hypothetical protein
VGYLLSPSSNWENKKFGTFLNENLFKMKYISNLLNPNPKIDLVTPNPKIELVLVLSREEPEHSSVRRAKRALGTDFRTGRRGLFEQ